MKSSSEPTTKHTQITINNGNGFHLPFPNGWCISVQVGPRNYCSNYDMNIIAYSEQPTYKSRLSSPDCEIAIFRPDNSWYKFEDGQEVKGHVGIEELHQWIEKIRKGELV